MNNKTNRDWLMLLSNEDLSLAIIGLANIAACYPIDQKGFLIRWLESEREAWRGDYSKS